MLIGEFLFCSNDLKGVTILFPCVNVLAKLLSLVDGGYGKIIHGLFTLEHSLESLNVQLRDFIDETLFTFLLVCLDVPHGNHLTYNFVDQKTCMRNLAYY